MTVEDGAKSRVDGPKLAKMIDSAVHRAAPGAGVSVSVIVGAPEVWRGAHALIPGRPYLGDAAAADTPPNPQNRVMTFEIVRARYTITGADGAMLESVPLVFDVGHGDTLESRLQAMRLTADYVALRVADLTK